MTDNDRPPMSARAALATFLVAAVALASGCGKTAPSRQMRVPVTVAPVMKRAVPMTILASGTVEPVQTADIGSQVGGTVTRIDFHEGQEVRSGQALIELDARPFRAALMQAQGQLARDRAQAVALRSDAQRATTLLQQQLMSQADFDAKRAAADAMTATVLSDSAAVAKARLDLEFATIRSPFAGRTGKLNVHVGDYVKAASSDPLVTVNQVRPIRVRFTVSESDRAAVERTRGRDPEVIVRLSPDDSLEIHGRLAFIDNAVDPSTGTLTLKGEFANRDGRLWPGAFVEVRLVLDVLHNAIVVPAPAISSGQQGPYVWVMNPDSSAASRPVTLLHADDSIAVVSSGLAPGEIVVTDGQLRIAPGARLQVRGGASSGDSARGGAARGGAARGRKS